MTPKAYWAFWTCYGIGFLILARLLLVNPIVDALKK
jgi:hypothetical protein